MQSFISSSSRSSAMSRQTGLFSGVNRHGFGCPMSFFYCRASPLAKPMERKPMPDVARFVVFMAAAFLLFVALLKFTTRKRKTKPTVQTTVAIAFVVVVLGMLFARYSHLAFPRLSWGIYYGVPALTTILLPALSL